MQREQVESELSPQSTEKPTSMQYQQQQQQQHQHNSIISYNHFRQVPNSHNQHHHNQWQTSSDDTLHQIQSHSQMRTKQHYYLQNNYNQHQLKQLASYAVAQHQHQHQHQQRIDTCQMQTTIGNHFAGAYETTASSPSSPLNQQQLVLYQPTVSGGAPRARVASVSGGSMCAPHVQIISQPPASTSPFFSRSSSFSTPLRQPPQQRPTTAGFRCSPSGHLLNNSANDSANLHQMNSCQLATDRQAFPYANPAQLATGIHYGSLSPGTGSSSAASSSSMSAAGVSAGASRQQANSPGSSMSPSDALSLGINLEQYISKRNERERSRVRNVNDAFDDLKKSLPIDSERLTKRMSKVEILRTAINYIRNMEEVLDCKQDQENSKSNRLSDEQDESSSESRLGSKRTRARPTDASPSGCLAEPVTSLHLSALSTSCGGGGGCGDGGGGGAGGGGEKGGGGTINYRQADTLTCCTGPGKAPTTSPAQLPPIAYTEVDHQHCRTDETGSAANCYEMAVAEPSQWVDWRQSLVDREVRTNSFNCSTVYQDDHLRNHYGCHYDEQQTFQGSR